MKKEEDEHEEKERAEKGDERKGTRQNKEHWNTGMTNGKR